MPIRWPILEVSDGHVYEAHRSIPDAKLPRIINRHVLSGSYSSRIISVHLSADICLVLCDSTWAFDGMEVVGNDNEWYVLSMRLSGDTLESVNGQEYCLSAGDAYLAHYVQGMSHILRSVSEQILIEACIIFRPKFVAEKLGVQCSKLSGVFQTGAGTENACFSRCRLTREMERTIRELRGSSPLEPYYRLHAEAMSLKLLSSYIAELRECPQHANSRLTTRAKDRLRMQQVKCHVEENYRQDIKIEDLCRLVGLNRRKLTRRFKQEFQLTIREFHQQVRMKIARVLLREMGGSVAEVAKRTGYAYSGNFAKAFQKVVGVSPKEYLGNASNAPRRGANLTSK